ncbi:phosphoglycolate phosphatase [Streptomyces albiflavescens]|uniref:Phosphoglycolate phosphatase n=1 Tax=Streptomyces albiflavescens TaxID=1623582 RepID=A0A918DA46_9ACTN|nr:HAD-IA family hydrolase [Streptomyces albiflavescens]GGN91384.1 phosphoglycolate phosphatase [Streptomyces albiflavescens]
MTHRTGLILDFGGVLTTPLLPAVLAFEKREGLPEGACITALYLDEAGARRTYDLERGVITQEEWNIAAARSLGLDSDNLMGRIFADLRPQTTMIKAAAAARQAGVKVGILTNSVGLDPWNLYDGYDLDQLYDAVVISEQHRMRKPEPAIFQLMLEMLAMSAEACVFVDDTEKYLAPAADLGLASVHAKDPIETIAQLEALLGVSLS